MRIRMICVDQSLVDGPSSLAPGESYRVGRSSRCAFVLDNLSVSRVHAEVLVQEEALSVTDLNSRNGTFVDGVRVGEATVQPGQKVSFGAALFHVVGDLTLHSAADDNSTLSTYLMNGRPSLRPDGYEELSDAQCRVLDLLLIGFSEKQVATKLAISINTVHNQVKRIYRRFGVASRAELLALFITEKKSP
ncbi:MAG: FHA domain-containing protein [Planctomycetes bacterium]|nr:FHA domain-containing protein [Planctomycetota bacterium]